MSYQTASECADGDIRLSRGSNTTTTEGHLEVCYDNEWGGVCADLWNRATAQVACRELGFASTGVYKVGVGGVAPRARAPLCMA